MEDKRHNLSFDAVINQGLAAAMLADESVGIRIMLEGGIPKPVITRMFITPHRRRSTDWQR
jgi:hypothetical protein